MEVAGPLGTPLGLAQRKSAIKDRNGMDLTEAEDIKKKWQEYTEELLQLCAQAR